MAGRVHERDRAAAGDGRHPVADQVPADHQDAGGLRAADELVRGQEDGVLVVTGAGRRLAGPDRHVRAGRRVVPERQRPVGVQQRGDRVGVGQDPGDVGRGGKAPDAQRPVCVTVQLRGQVGQVDVPVGVGADDHDVGDGLPPGQLVGVMLIRPHEHHRPLRWRDLVQEPVAPREPVGQAQFQDADQLADRRRGARSAEDHQMVAGAADRVVDDLPGLFPQPPGRQARARTLGMGVGVAGQHLIADEVLDEI